MAYNSYQSNNYKSQNRYSSQPQQPPAALQHPPLELPKDYVEAAEKVMLSLGQYDERSGKYVFKITTSKIRSFLSLANDIYNIENTRKDETLTEESMNKINMMRVRILYEAGRYEAEVKPFIEKSKLISYIKGIGTSRKKLIDFCKYLEALVAYHRYLGGKES
ncbi:MAG TPA: type III-A CRISPR-associated protein Csm2 [Candidatus Avimonas sp.]|nr:type III-A CRISPR-associated protein Csm2 [Clostridiales bacterium]HPU57990.1 type III-A CRISPR-associated protein Csm2 [Candidatus Avimonas sp.]